MENPSDGKHGIMSELAYIRDLVGDMGHAVNDGDLLKASKILRTVDESLGIVRPCLPGVGRA